MEALIFFALIFSTIIVAVVLVETKKDKLIEARMTVEDNLQKQGFNIEKQAGLTAKLYIDNIQKLWAVNEWTESTNIKIYKFSDLIDFELIEDDISLMSGGMGKALVGGALGGTKGAIIGSAGSRQIKQKVTRLEIKIRTNDFEHPQQTIQLIKGFGLSKSSPAYDQYFDAAQEIIGLLNYIATNGKLTQPEATVPAVSKDNLGSKLRELNELKNEGIITVEEFEAKKKELLNL